MQHIRLIVRHNPEDPADDLRIAARLRRDLWAHSPVEIDPDNSRHGTHRDSEHNAFFEFATDRKPEVERMLQEFGYGDRATIKVIQEGGGTDCPNCGNIPPELVTICPNCHFREIDPCPHCNNEIARVAYLPRAGDLFQCPNCHHKVRLQFNDPLFNSEGNYIQPLIRVVTAEAPVPYDI